MNIDAAVRYRRDLHAFDEAYWSFRVYTDAFENGKFEAFFNDSTVSDYEKAKRLYQLSLSYYNVGHLDKSDLHAKKVVELYPNVDYYCASARYSIANHKFIRGNFLGAIEDFLKILEDYPEIDFAPKVMTKIGDSFLRIDRQAEAVYVYDTAAKLYPHRLEGMGSVQSIEFILQGRPDLQNALELARATGGANLAMKKLPPILAMKLPPIMKRIDKMKKTLELAMLARPDRGESIEDRIFNIK